MQREIPRTLRTMLPPVQKCVTGAEYEIIIIDNGSERPLSLDEVDAHGVDIRMDRTPPDRALPSPVSAMNAAARDVARGDALLICIDGARMFSPYIVRRTIDALERQADAFTFVGSRHLGQEVQMKAVKAGYDQGEEDALLRTVRWADDADELHGISVWAGAHSFRSAFYQNESNAFGLRRALWEEVGAYNSRFERPGGGLCNLEMFRRYVTSPAARNVLLLGESTFHQFHGGAATARAGYFGESREEYRQATGADYALPRYDFEVDTGQAYDRQSVIERWYHG